MISLILIIHKSEIYLITTITIHAIQIYTVSLHKKRESSK